MSGSWPRLSGLAIQCSSRRRPGAGERECGASTSPKTEYERERQEAATRAAASGEPHSPWHSVAGWRLNGPAVRTWRFCDGSKVGTVAPAPR